jgi:hypothetical protein
MDIAKGVHNHESQVVSGPRIFSSGVSDAENDEDVVHSVVRWFGGLVVW